MQKTQIIIINGKITFTRNIKSKIIKITVNDCICPKDINYYEDIKDEVFYSLSDNRLKDDFKNYS